MLRTALIAILLFVLVRYVIKLLSPRREQRGNRVAGTPARPSGRVDESRIQDANFKDIPKE